MTAVLRVLGSFAIALTVGLLGATATAQHIDEFRAARALYAQNDWAGAAAAFEALIGSDPPRLDSPELVLEARKYLAAAYVFLNREDAARREFERLLADDPSYVLDRAQFPRAVVELFDSVRERLQQAEQLEVERASLVAENTRLRAENELLRSELARDVEVRLPRSLALAQIPFGVGQFENGDDALGMALLVSEVLLGATLAVSAGLQTSVAGDLLANPERFRDAAYVDSVRTTMNTLAIINWTSAGLLAAAFITGLVQANVAYEPTRSVRVRRSPVEAHGLSLRVAF